MLLKKRPKTQQKSLYIASEMLPPYLGISPVYNFVFQQLKPLVLARSKTLFLKKITGDDAKKIKRLPEIQALTKDFTSYKIR